MRELEAVLNRYDPLGPFYTQIRGYHEFVPYLQGQDLIPLYRPHEHLSPLYIALNHSVLTHELDADHDPARALPGGSPHGVDQPLACVLAIVAEDADAVHAGLHVVTQHRISRLLVESAEDLGVPLVHPQVLRVEVEGSG